MGTRALIRIEGFRYAQIYKHWDGYPEGMLPWLESFNKKFTENRGSDPSYKFAQLLRSSVRDAEDFDLDNSEYLGWGVVPFGDSYGQEYVYKLKTDGSVVCNTCIEGALYREYINKQVNTLTEGKTKYKKIQEISSSTPPGPPPPVPKVKEDMVNHIDLIDYFAGQALAGLLSNSVISFLTREDKIELISKDAYDYAEAMKKEKERRKG